MKELAHDLWDYKCDARCITTNGTIRTVRGVNGGVPANIMGGGCAGEARIRYPSIEVLHGHFIRAQGVNVYYLPWNLIMFPTKWSIQERASLDLIVRSAHQLVEVMDLYHLKKVALPRPGSGLGGLDWADVRPVLTGILDDRVTVLRYPGEAR